MRSAGEWLDKGVKHGWTWHQIFRYGAFDVSRDVLVEFIELVQKDAVRDMKDERDYARRIVGLVAATIKSSSAPADSVLRGLHVGTCDAVRMAIWEWDRPSMRGDAEASEWRNDEVGK